MIWNSQHGFTTANLIASCDEMTSSVDERKTENVVYMEFSKAFHGVSHRILVSSFRWPSLDKQKTEQIIGQKGSCSLQRQVTVEFPGGLSYLISLAMTRSQW